MQLNKSIKGQPIKLRGVTYTKGLGTHANSSIVYKLNGAYTNFVSDVGIDDEVAGLGNVIFTRDRRRQDAVRQRRANGASPIVHVNVDVTGVQQLTLVVANGVAGVDYDHADWAGPQLLQRPRRATAPMPQRTSPPQRLTSS